MLEDPRVARLADDLSDPVVIAAANRENLGHAQLSPPARRDARAVGKVG